MSKAASAAPPAAAAPAAMATCRRCHAPFDRASAARDRPLDCRFHSGLWVCRWHPDEVDSCGDGEGYYGGGLKGWNAKFWDCCGAETEDAKGCRVAPHRSYDDSDSEDDA